MNFLFVIVVSLLAIDAPSGWSAVGRASDGPWVASDEFQYLSARPTMATAIATDEQGNLVVGGLGGSGGWQGNNFEDIWVVRQSRDQGKNWRTIDEYQLVAGSTAQVTSIAVFGPRIYVLGKALDGKEKPHLILRRSLDGGSNWQTVLDMPIDNFYFFDPKVLTQGQEVYLLFYKNDIPNLSPQLWRSADDGATWTEIDGIAPPNVYPKDLTIDPTGLFFLSSTRFDSTTNVRTAEVKRSGDGGATWETLIEVNSPYNLGKYNFLVSPDGTYFFLCYGSKFRSTSMDLVLYRSQDAGKSWSVIQQTIIGGDRDEFYAGLVFLKNSMHLYGSMNDFGSWLRSSEDLGTTWSEITVPTEQLFTSAVATDSTLFFAGDDRDSSWSVQSIGDADNKSLVTMDSFGIIGSSASARSMAITGSGHLVTVGTGLDHHNFTHGLVRLSHDDGKTWKTTDDYAAAPNNKYDGPDYEEVVAFGSNVVVGGNMVRTPARTFIRRSADEGMTWKNAAEFPDELFGSLAVDPQGRYYLSTVMGLVLIIRRSDDGGSSWETVFQQKMETGFLWAKDLQFLSTSDFIMNLSSRDSVPYLGQVSGDSIVLAPLDGKVFFRIEQLIALSRKTFYAVVWEDWKYNLYLSSDGANTWTFQSMLAPAESEDFEFTRIISLPNGDLIMSGYDDRDSDQVGYLMVSHDQGKTFEVETQFNGLGDMERTTAWGIGFDQRGTAYAMGQSSTPRGGEWTTWVRPATSHFKR